MKVMFVEARAKDKVKLDAKVLASLKQFNSIGLLATIQFIDSLNSIKTELEKQGKKVIISEPSKHTVYPGQVLGCDVSAAISIQDKVDCFLYIGDGKFHPLGIAIQTNKPVLTLNPYNNTIGKIDENEKRRWLSKQAARVSKVKDAKTIGILVSTKPGQHNLEKALQIKKALEKKSKQVFLFIADTFNPNDLLNFPQIQAWINTACPRIVDDQEVFKKPIADVRELNLQ